MDHIPEALITPEHIEKLKKMLRNFDDISTSLSAIPRDQFKQSDFDAVYQEKMPESLLPSLMDCLPKQQRTESSPGFLYQNIGEYERFRVCFRLYSSLDLFPENAPQFALSRIVAFKEKESAIGHHWQESQQNLKEVSKLKRLNHVFIVGFYMRMGLNGYVGSMLLSGSRPTLDRYLQRADLTQAVRYDLAYGVISALKYLHDENIIHRDLQCANVLVQELQPGVVIPKLTNFRYAQALSGYCVHINDLPGNPASIVPVLFSSFKKGYHPSYQKETDIYAFAILFWQCLTS